MASGTLGTKGVIVNDRTTETTPGRVLWGLELPLSDFPKRRPWEAFDERDRARYEQRAGDILSTAAKLMEAIYGQ